MPIKTKGNKDHKIKILKIMSIKLMRVGLTFMGFQWPLKKKKDLANNH